MEEESYDERLQISTEQINLHDFDELGDITGFSNEERFQSLVPIESLQKVDLANLPAALTVHFVQTATNKYLYFFLSIMLFIISWTLFMFRRRFY